MHRHELRLRLRPSDRRRAETSYLHLARLAADPSNGTAQRTPGVVGRSDEWSRLDMSESEVIPFGCVASEFVGVDVPVDGAMPRRRP